MNDLVGDVTRTYPGLLDCEKSVSRKMKGCENGKAI